MAPPLSIHAFQTARPGNGREDCEDALASNPERSVFAIADGVSDSAFQALWARLLVESFVLLPDGPPAKPDRWVPGWLGDQQRRWHEGIPWESLPWHGERKARSIGGLATFAGIRLEPSGHTWAGIAIGDCELFQFDASGRMVRWEPLASSADFGRHPPALSSIDRDYERVLRYLHPLEGHYTAGDTFILATDAVARWLLARWEQGPSPFSAMTALRSEEDFAALVEDARRTGQMVEDDSSLLVVGTSAAVSIEPGEPVPVESFPARAPRRPRAWLPYLAALTCGLAGFVVGMAVGAERKEKGAKRMTHDDDSPGRSG